MSPERRTRGRAQDTSPDGHEPRATDISTALVPRLSSLVFRFFFLATHNYRIPHHVDQGAVDLSGAKVVQHFLHCSKVVPQSLGEDVLPVPSCFMQVLLVGSGTQSEQRHEL